VGGVRSPALTFLVFLLNTHPQKNHKNPWAELTDMVKMDAVSAGQRQNARRQYDVSPAS
jgi:hypothetical protein